MNHPTRALLLLACALPCAAEDSPAPSAPASAAVSAPASAAAAAPTSTPNRALPTALTRALASRPRQILPGAPAASAATASGPPGASTEAVKFSSEDKWVTAGYNNNEIVYTIFVTSQDSRILRCVTEVKGVFLDRGEKVSISDRQVTTVFPNQPTQVGNWMDMDQQSGASYSVKCRPV